MSARNLLALLRCRPASIALSAALVAVCSATASTAGAAPEAAAAVEVKRMPFQKMVFSGCGGNSGHCDVFVARVPRKRHLEITSASCRATVEAPANPDFFELRYDFDPDQSIFDFMVPVKTSTRVGTEDTLLATTHTLFVGKAGYRLFVAVNGTTDVKFLACRVSGQKVVLE